MGDQPNRDDFDPDRTAKEVEWARWQPTAPATSLAETMYRAGYAAALAAHTPTATARRTPSQPFAMGLSCGLAMSVLVWALRVHTPGLPIDSQATTERPSATSSSSDVAVDAQHSLDSANGLHHDSSDRSVVEPSPSLIAWALPMLHVPADIRSLQADGGTLSDSDAELLEIHSKLLRPRKLGRDDSPLASPASDSDTLRREYRSLPNRNELPSTLFQLHQSWKQQESL